MPDLEIIDVHTHTFASADRGIAYQRAASEGAREPTRKGTVEELRGLMGETGMSRAVMLIYTPTLTCTRRGFNGKRCRRIPRSARRSSAK